MGDFKETAATVNSLRLMCQTKQIMTVIIEVIVVVVDRRTKVPTLIFFSCIYRIRSNSFQDTCTFKVLLQDKRN